MMLDRLQAQDRPRIWELLQRRAVFNPAEIAVAMELVDQTLAQPDKRDYLFCCARLEQIEMAGYACFGPIPMTLASFDLYWLVVDERCGRRGVAGALLEDVQRQVRRQGGRYLYVETSSTPGYAPARAFYLKHGFVLKCTLEHFYRPGDHKMLFSKML